ncbi:MAG TPA: DinB family protein [Anaerolineae bacterium]|nr:DinB family protein [Anaerolineae bacterium]
MNTVELVQHSVRSAFEILEQVTDDLTPAQADWAPPGCANPIGAMYWHTISGADEVVYRWFEGGPCLHEREGWRARVLRVDVPEPQGSEGWLEWMRAIRVDLPAMHDYARAVAADLDTWLASKAPEDLDRIVHTPIGDFPVAVALDTFVIWHINAHCGEISALKGCQGAKGYPF